MTNESDGADSTRRKNRNPTIHTRGLDRAPSSWHETGALPDGTPVGKLGGLWYILDDDGEPITDGHHEIHIEGDRYKGKLGARIEVINVP